MARIPNFTIIRKTFTIKEDSPKGFRRLFHDFKIVFYQTLQLMREPYFWHMR